MGKAALPSLRARPTTEGCFDICHSCQVLSAATGARVLCRTP